MLAKSGLALLFACLLCMPTVYAASEKDKRGTSHIVKQIQLDIAVVLENQRALSKQLDDLQSAMDALGCCCGGGGGGGGDLDQVLRGWK